tara:strand:+ start:193 stop:1167 length:975 start_codon:yes stop_codon:yes gene_type:complete
MANGRSGGRGSAPSAGARGRSRQGASPRGGAKGGKRFGAEGFRRAAKAKTGMTLADFTKQIAEAQARQSAATTASEKAAAAKAVKAAEAAKKTYMTQTATAREKKRGGGESSARVATVTSRAGKAGTKQGQSRRGGMTGTGGKSPGPRGQRGGTPGRGAMSADRDRQGQSPRGGRRGGRRGGGGGGGRGGRGGRGGCFVAETLVQMLDGTTKPIIDIQVGEHTKGGIVESKMEFLPTNIYNYKGVEVSGSHWVIEDNQFTEVENSKHGILTDKIETVYCFKTSERRIWVNDIEFGDYESGSQEDWEPHFEQVKEKLNRELLLKQ